MTADSAGVIPFVIAQHVEDAAFLHAVRTRLARASHVKFKELATFDTRLAAQIDALTIAGDAGWPFCEAALESPSSGAVFTAAVRAIEDRDGQRLTRLLSLAEASPPARRGLASGFGWVDQSTLQGTVVALLRDEEPFRRLVGLTACGMHRVDCGLATGPWIHDRDAHVRARAIRTAGETGSESLLSQLTDALDDEDDNCRFWAAWSAVLLGYSGSAVRILASAGATPGPHSERAFVFALQAMKRNEAHSFVSSLADDVSNLQRVQGSGIIGDPAYVPWLITEMAKPMTARRAAEAFSLISGVDLAGSPLRADRPKDFESGPTDNPEDGDVALDADDGLPWPDPEKVGAWWAANESRFQQGTRYFMGQPVTREHCVHVLKTGYQRQRILAAHYLCLLDPGTPLFNTSAPAWRQQRLLEKM
jgi:uncharacterized protein (TIGR02270 family)